MLQITDTTTNKQFCSTIFESKWGGGKLCLECELRQGQSSLRAECLHSAWVGTTGLGGNQSVLLCIAQSLRGVDKIP